MSCSTYCVKLIVTLAACLAAGLILTCGQKAVEPENPNPAAPLEADFQASDTTGTPPLTVQFTDQSVGGPDFWFWRFGDGKTSFEQNPSHQYLTDGSYDVSLVVSRGGMRDSLMRSGLVQVSDSGIVQAPHAQFAASPDSGVAPLEVQFVNQSTGTISSTTWDFGDGNSSDQSSPTHVFSSPDVYAVRLIVTGPGGADTLLRPECVRVLTPPPTAQFTSDTRSGQPPLAVNFSNMSIGVITDFKWYFGDGDSSTVRNPSHSYNAAGLYSVTLIAVGPGGADTVTIADYIAVSDGRPVAAFTANPTEGVAPLSIQFTNNSAGAITNQAWDFGDGVTSILSNPMHQYAVAGDYTVRLIVTGPGGADTALRSNYILVRSAPPVADFGASPTGGLVPLSVSFTDLSSGDITSYLWSFGDGQTSALPAPTHQYLSAGQFSVRLIVTGPGGIDTLTRTNFIQAIWPAPTAAFSGTPTSGLLPLHVGFTNSSSGQITGYAWDFGDGVTSQVASPTHDYTSAGVFSVRLIVTGPGGSDTLSRLDYINVAWPPPVADFSGTPTEGTVPFEVSFANASSGQITGYTWDFGDGGISVEATPKHTYTSHGNYSVRLIVSGPGGVDTLTRDNYITANAVAPTAQFTANPTSGHIPLVVQFTDQSTGIITSWNWRFGTTITSAVRNPSITFSNPGSYDVRLIVSGPGGIDTLLRTAYVSALPPAPIADFSGLPTEGEVPLTVTFNNVSQGTFSTSEWDFGDGATSNTLSPTHQYQVPGVYNVRLIVRGAGGEDTLTRVGYITARTPRPVASFDGTPTSGVAPLSVQFTDHSTGEIDLYQWAFGDGVTSNLRSPSHDYTAPGRYDVRLIVIGPGGEDTLLLSEYIEVLTPPPHAAFEAVPTTGTAPLSVQFNDLSTGAIDSYLWDFGDGNSSTLRQPLHIYDSPGRYTVRLSINGPGGSDTAQRDDYVDVLIPPPTVDFTAIPISGVAPLSVTFTNLATGQIDSYQWDFGDGTSVAAENPSHDYLTPGNYSVRLTAIGPGGSSDLLKSDLISVLYPPPTADFGANPLSGTAPLQVSFTDMSAGQIDKYSWDFGDGASSEEIDPVHIYGNAGVYSVSHTVSGPGGEETATRTGMIAVTDNGPVAEFDAAPTSGTAPLTVQFFNHSTGQILTNFWDFGDGQTSLLAEPSHEYQNSGSYTVTLAVVAPSGVDTLRRTEYILVTPAPPVASFSADQTTGVAPLDVQFSDLTTGLVDSVLWNFGDGSISAERAPVHQYIDPGTYTVSLAAFGPGGSDTLEVVDYITVLVPNGVSRPPNKSQVPQHVGDSTPGRKE